MDSSKGELLNNKNTNIISNNKSKKLKKIFKRRQIVNKNNIKSIENNNTNKNNIIKIRNPAVDLLRLISMYGIVINHILYFGNGMGKYQKYQRQLKLLHIILFFHNNSFSLISGIVGYKTNKYSNLLYLWLSTVFYSVGSHVYYKYIKHKSDIDNDISVNFFPVIYRRYWYITAYFGMYLFLPIVNKGISILTKSELKLVVISTIGIFAFWRDLKNITKDNFQLNGGGCSLWLMTLFVVGAYIGKYKSNLSIRKKIILCMVCIFFYYSSTLLYYKSINNKLNFGSSYYGRKVVEKLKIILTERYDSILKIVQSISVTLFFLQLKYNKYLSKIIIFLGQRAIGIYLFHSNKLVNKYFVGNLFKNDPSNLSLNAAIKVVLLKALKVCMMGIGIEYIRYLLFNILRIRKICIFLEKLIFKIFG